MSIPAKDSTAPQGATYVEGAALYKGMKNKGKCEVVRGINQFTPNPPLNNRCSRYHVLVQYHWYRAPNFVPAPR